MARRFQIVVFGATGFVGRLVCQYLAGAGQLEPGQWAIAGRNVTKLEALRAELAREHPELARLTTLIADVEDEDSVRAMVEDAKVLLTTVGPYERYGEPVLAACARVGTHYADLTGEPHWWAQMIERYHDIAEKTGSRIVPACGFDSVPFDLGAMVTGRRMTGIGPKRIRGYFSARASVSGGTWNSLLGILASVRQSPSPPGPRPSVFHRCPELRGWALGLPTIDPLVVARSVEQRADLDSQLRYEHYFRTGNLFSTLVVAFGLAGVFLMAQISPLRWLLGHLLPPGHGPSAQRRARSWFRVDCFGEREGEVVHVQMKGGDPGYGETAKIIGEAALCLALDPLPEVGGVLTSASAMGDALVERLERVQLSFRVQDEADEG